MIPFIGTQSSDAIKSIGKFIKTKELKKNAKLILKIAHDSVYLCQLVGKSIIYLIENEKKKKQIFNVDEINIKSKLDSNFKKIKNCFEEIYEKLNEKLYGETFDNPAKKLGNLDANLLIEKYLQNHFKSSSILEKEFSDYLIESVENTPIVEDKTKAKDKIIKRNCACSIF